MITGTELRLLRQIRNYSQLGMAKKLGITQQGYSKLEKQDKVSDANCYKILEILSVKIEDVKAILSILPPPPIKLKLFKRYCTSTI